MHYYQHHIGDFDRATRHLTRIERSVYLDLIFAYYEGERPLPLDRATVCRKILARSSEEKAAVLTVLGEFFHETPSGWFHDRCEEEIDAYRKSKSQASAAGKASAAAKAQRRAAALTLSPATVGQEAIDSSTTVERALNGRATDPQQPINGMSTNHKPVTSNHNPIIELPHTPQAGLQKKSSSISLGTYLEQCKAAGQKPVPETASVFAYAESVGISQEFLRLQWLEFKERYAAPDAKRYKSWPSVFDRSVRGNWFKLWYASNDNGYALTTVGQQAQRRHKEAA